MVKVRIKKEQIELILAHRNKSQNWLAENAKISSGYLSQIINCESYNRYPSGRMRKRIMDTLEITDFDQIFEII